MTTYYVGPGGNDGNDGLSWANRFLTLNGAEDEPVAAGDTVYVGPGVYREMLTVDVSGTNGNPITYVGDVTGDNTDSIGGVVRITASDNDQSSARARCIYASAARDYRTFRGFRIDGGPSTAGIHGVDCGNWIIEDCVFSDHLIGIFSQGSGQNDWTIRRCILVAILDYAVYFYHSTDVTGADHLIDNCIMTGTPDPYGTIQVRGVGDITIKNCVIGGGYCGIRVRDTTSGQVTYLYNSIVFSFIYGLRAAVLGDIVENYNTIIHNTTARDNVNVGANSNTYYWLPNLPILHAGASQTSGYKFPWWFGELSEWSQIRGIVGTGTTSVDLLGLPRSAIEAKSSWGPLEFMDYERETGTTRGASEASIVLHDAGVYQMFVPTDDTTGTFSCYVYRESDYSGTAPRMVLKQPGQSDRTTTDAGGAASWNQLTDTFAPAADPPYVLVELQSLNVNPSGNFDVFFDDLSVD